MYLFYSFILFISWFHYFSFICFLDHEVSLDLPDLCILTYLYPGTVLSPSYLASPTAPGSCSGSQVLGFGAMPEDQHHSRTRWHPLEFQYCTDVIIICIPQILTDPHSPSRFRVNGPFANLAEFSEVTLSYEDDVRTWLTGFLCLGLGLPCREPYEPCKEVSGLVIHSGAETSENLDIVTVNIIITMTWCKYIPSNISISPWAHLLLCDSRACNSKPKFDYQKGVVKLSCTLVS